MVRVLVVGQTPPPYGGQPIMIDYLVHSHMQGVELRHLRMELSTDASQVGKFGWKKMLRLLPIIARIIRARIVYRPHILYYAPAGANLTSLLRDVAILGTTRFLFPKTVFHFHAGGHSEAYEQMPRWQRWLFRCAYFHADAAIRLSDLNPQDGKRIEAGREYIVPNGVPDPCPDLVLPPADGSLTESRPLRVLFVGMLSETKGLLDLVEACGRLSARGVPFRLEIMGQPESDKFIARLRARIVDLNLCRHVQFLGVLTGREKFAAFARSDVFCMPTFYERETFGIVFVEAMACGLPVVATRWRGVPSVVDDGRTGFLVEPRDVDGIANRLADLADNAQLRRQMGVAGRERFLREFSLPRHIARMRRVFLDVAGLAREAKEIESPDESLALATTDD